jgi:hypothetical protein
MFNPDKYRSVTWLKGGRVYPQLDCFGIVNEIRRDLGLPEWPDFAGVTKDGGGLDREARKLMLSLKRCDPVKVPEWLAIRAQQFPMSGSL